MLIYVVNKQWGLPVTRKQTCKPKPGLGGSLHSDQLLHTWLRGLGIFYMVLWVFMGTPSIIALIKKKKNEEKNPAKMNKVKIFMGLGGANLEISLAQIEMFSRQ